MERAPKAEKKKDEKGKFIGFKLSIAELKKLDKYCHKAGLSRSVIVRRALHAYLRDK